MDKIVSSINSLFTSIAYMFLYIIECRTVYQSNINKLMVIGAWDGLDTVNKSLDVYSKLFAAGMQDSDVDKIVKLLAQGKLK